MPDKSQLDARKSIPDRSKFMVKNRILEHPILQIPESELVEFTWDGKRLQGIKGMVITSVLYMNGIEIFGYHPKDSSPQGLFCANGQCSQCMVLVNGYPKKGCITPLEENMNIESCKGLPELPKIDNLRDLGDPETIETQVLIIGGGPSGLSAANIFTDYGLEVIVVDDKGQLGGKLVLQTHKFFGSEKDVYAGKRGIDIAKILQKDLLKKSNIDIWLNSTALAVFSDGYVGVLKNNDEFVRIKPEHIFIATGAREKMLAFPGDTLPGVIGAGAFQTLVNRDFVKPAKKIFIIGGGNVGLIAGYHAIQAGIEVTGLVEALPQCGGYKVHEDKLRRLGVPIYTSHTIISAHGKDKVESVTCAKLDENWKVIDGTKKTFEADMVLIAVGLEPVDSFYQKAKEYGFSAFVAGDAQEIAEASAAIFTGKVEAIKLLQEIGIKTEENLKELEEKAQLMKNRPPAPLTRKLPELKEGIFPLFHCNQEIPCNPCTSVCPQGLIHTEDDLITHLPFFTGEKECIGCARCVAVCPGLAVTLIDFRKEGDPVVTFPFEIGTKMLEKGEKVTVLSDEGSLGQFEVQKARILKQFPKTQLISIKLPQEIAKQAVNIRTKEDIHIEPMEVYHERSYPDEAIICRCERITAGEIRKWIQRGVTDVNEMKTLTRVQMGACGGKTCTSLIAKLYREEGLDFTPGTTRPLFVEVPLGVFAKKKGDT